MAYYWRAFNEFNVPKPSIAKALAAFFNRKVYGAKSGAHIEVMHNKRWIDSQDYKNKVGHWPSGTFSVVVPEPDEKRETYDEYMKDKQELASFLLAKNLDVNYRDSRGSTLLMSVIVSYFPNEWKEKAVITLIEKGCDVNDVNKYGKTAFDLTSFKQNKQIIKILSEAKNLNN